MKFEAFAKCVTSHRRRVEEVEREHRREWEMPGGRIKIHVAVYPRDDGAGMIMLDVYSAQPALTATSQSPVVYWNRVDRPLTDLTARDLSQLLAVRLFVERWVEGFVDELPAEFPA